MTEPAKKHLRVIDATYCRCGCGEQVPSPRRRSEPQRQYRPGHHARVQALPLAERFSAKVEAATDLSPNGMDGCLLWMGATREDGYGLIWRDGTNARAHRVAFELAGFVIPADEQLDHLCRRRNCVNTAHLEAVTQRENIRRGAATKLSARQAGEIRASVERGMTRADVASAYGISKEQVCSIARRESWADV